MKCYRFFLEGPGFGGTPPPEPPIPVTTVFFMRSTVKLSDTFAAGVPPTEYGADK